MTATPSHRGPLVTVLVPTFNRRRYLAEALRSLAGQTYANFEAVVVNDGGEPVADVVAALADPRFTLIERRDNRGKAASLNEGLARARGSYVAYLDDDDLYYPAHLAALLDALQADGGCGAAYTDLYKVHCRVRPDGSRQVLGKIVNVSRDFDRFLICHFNHVLHVSLMHRRDLLDRTGPYNERLRVLVDWDMTRRLAFFTDFRHVPRVTGEYYAPVGPSDRLSYRQRLQRQAYLEQVLAVRTTRPAKPWPKMPDLAIILLAGRMDARAAGVLRQALLWTFMPYRVYLPLAAEDASRLRTDAPVVAVAPVAAGAGRAECLDAALGAADADFAAVVPPGVAPGLLWVEDALHAAVTSGAADRTAFLIRCAAGAPPWADADWPPVVLRLDALRRARAAAAGAPLAHALRAAGIAVRPPCDGERALQFDRLLQQAQAMEAEGNWAQAAWRYERLRARWANHRWMDERAARALFRAGGRDRQALELVRRLNRAQPTVDTLLLEAKLLRRGGAGDEAAALLERAEQILSGKALP